MSAPESRECCKMRAAVPRRQSCTKCTRAPQLTCCWHELSQLLTCSRPGAGQARV